MTKQEMSASLKHAIRNDTYLFITRMMNGEEYQTIYDDLDSNRIFYGIKKDTCLSREKTILGYLEDLGYKEAENKLSHRTRKNAKEYGVYGIYADDKLIYIGKTIKTFKERFSQHLNKLQHDDEAYIYKRIKYYKDNNCNISLRPLISNLSAHREFTDDELKLMEYSLITVLQPEGNIEGRLKEYKF